MNREGDYVCFESDVFAAMRISDKIKGAPTLEKVAPADLVEYLETQGRSH